MIDSNRRTFHRVPRLFSLLVALQVVSAAYAAQNDTDLSANAQSMGAMENESEPLTEIVVTAEKVREPALNVPMALTVLTGPQLLQAHSFRFQDFVETVPGLQMESNQYGTFLVIRGLSASLAFNTTSAYIDDTPLTLEGPFSINPETSDLDTFDMQRIEVLKGPQGTLYGANSLSGVVKYVTNSPDPTGLHVTSEAGVTSVYHGGTGFDVHGMLNLPISSIAALRIVGYDNYYPGFINDPSRNRSGINGVHYAGSRAALLLKPSSALSVRLNVLYQNRNSSNIDQEEVAPVSLNPIYGDLATESLIDQPTDSILRVYNLTATYDVASAEILSTTSYSDFSVSAKSDYSGLLGALATELLKAPSGLAIDSDLGVRSFTQEMRVSSTRQEPLGWIFGAYFTNENNSNIASDLPISVSTRNILTNASLGEGSIPTHYAEYAGFLHLDYFITQSFDIAAGGRYSHNNQSFRQATHGILYGGGQNFGRLSSESVVTYSGDLRWHVSPIQIVYVHVAKGFAPGGPNDDVPTAINLPRTYSSSTTQNYELGAKGKFLSGRAEFQVDAFHIDWDKIQLQAVIGGFGTITNGGKAVSNGAEGSFSYEPLSSLTLGLNVSYVNAHLTEATPASVGGQPGTRLPNSPLWSASTYANYEKPLFGDHAGFIGVGWRYTGASYAAIMPTRSGPRQLMPSYSIVDLRTGLETPRWTATFYVKNVGNKRAITGLSAATLQQNLGPQFAFVETPRTYGFSISAGF